MTHTLSEDAFRAEATRRLSASTLFRAWGKSIYADFGNYCYKGLRHRLSHGWNRGPAPVPDPGGQPSYLGNWIS